MILLCGKIIVTSSHTACPPAGDYARAASVRLRRGQGADIRGWRNRSRILQEIRRAGRISRRGLFEITGIRPNTVGEIVTELLDSGLLEEVGTLGGRRGRHRRLLALSPGGKVLGAELFEGALRVGALGLDGEVLETVEHRLSSERRADVVGALIDALRPLANAGSVFGIGVAVAGVVDSERGVSRRIAHFEGWEDVPLGPELEQAFGVPVRLGNLTEVRLVDLKHRGAIRPGMTAALVVLEPGAIGCGIVAEGQILRGAVEASSELGQTLVMSEGRWLRLETLTDWTRLRRTVVF
jgi:DNA-binding Lrp family transcriptional regulator